MRAYAPPPRCCSTPATQQIPAASAFAPRGVVTSAATGRALCHERDRQLGRLADDSQRPNDRAGPSRPARERTIAFVGADWSRDPRLATSRELVCCRETPALPPARSSG